MKKESSFKMKGFSGFKKATPGGDLFTKAGRAKKLTLGLDFTLNNKLNKAVLGQQSRRTTDIVSKKPASYAEKSFNQFQQQKRRGKVFVKNLIKKGGKFFGGKALGVAGMMMGTMGTADANPANKGKMSMKQERNLVKRVRNIKKK